MEIQSVENCGFARHGESGERGAILILVAVLAVVLIMFAALVVDLTMFEDSREQTEYDARKAALAALSAHLSSSAPTFSAKAAEALTRAQEVVGGNFMLSDGSSKTASVSLSSGTGAWLRPGIYYFGPPCDNPADCPVCEPEGFPCFEPADASNPKVTAYEITGALYESISTRFARAVFGVNELPVNVFARASVYPRQGCFLVDISGSMSQETNRFQLPPQQAANPRAGHGSYFAYTVSSENTFSTPYTRQDAHWSYLTNTAPTRPTSAAQWTAFAGVPPASITEEQYGLMHFEDDHMFLETLGDSDYPNLSAEIRALHPDPSLTVNGISFSAGNRFMAHVDTRRITPGDDPIFPSYSYEGAEPLHTVFRGLRQAMEYFKQRQVAGDAACLILYDQQLSYMRYVKLTNNFDYIISLTDFENRASLASPGIEGDVDVVSRVNGNLATGFERIVRQGMLPLGPTAGYTNTLLALSAAMNELQEGNPEGGFASNFITIIGDGLGNCVPCTVGSTGCNNGYRCNNAFRTFNSAQANILNWTNTNLQARNIPVHWILVGGSVAPHTLSITSAPSGTGPCMTDQEARRFIGGPGLAGVPMVRGGYGTVDGSGNLTFTGASCKSACDVVTSAACAACEAAFLNMSPTTPFLEPNAYAYEMAAATRGLWGPIRPTRPGCTPVTTCDTQPANWASAAAILQDPKCRTEQQQIDDYMAEIIGGNPIALVEVQ